MVERDRRLRRDYEVRQTRSQGRPFAEGPLVARVRRSPTEPARNRYAVIAGKSPEALRVGKAAFRAQAGLPLADAYDVAVATMVDNMFADDAKEGIGAFLGKRMPEWT